MGGAAGYLPTPRYEISFCGRQWQVLDDSISISVACAFTRSQTTNVVKLVRRQSTIAIAFHQKIGTMVLLLPQGHKGPKTPRKCHPDGCSRVDNRVRWMYTAVVFSCQRYPHQPGGLYTLVCGVYSKFMWLCFTCAIIQGIFATFSFHGIKLIPATARKPPVFGSR
jgi:hypothetical protein